MAKKSKTKTKPLAYVPIKNPGQFQTSAYNSQYADQLQDALSGVVNFKYDPLQDANYQALAKVYGARGNIAAKDTLADAAALNGGFGTSYAVSAAQQTRNQYNQELASLIPDLEANAYNKAQGAYSTLASAENMDYDKYRDSVSDQMFAYEQAVNQYQFGKNFNLGVKQYLNTQKKSGGSGGGGGGRRSSGYSSYKSPGSNSNNDPYKAAQQEANRQTYVQPDQDRGKKRTEQLKKKK